MPRYTYRCDSCAVVYEVTHSMSESLVVCKDCDTEALVRVPSVFTSNLTKGEHKDNLPPGTVVREFIADTKEEIKREKKNMTKDLEA